MEMAIPGLRLGGSGVSDLDPVSLREVEKSAHAGAKSATDRIQVVRDAVEHTVNVWTLAVLGHHEIENPKSWAFRVGQNAARKLAALNAKTEFWEHATEGMKHEPSVARVEPNVAPGDVTADQLKAMIASMVSQLTLNQCAVGSKMCEPGMTLHRAAKELGKDRSDVRRTWKSLLARLRRIFSGPK